MTAKIEVPVYLRKNPKKETLEMIIEQKEQLKSTLVNAQIQLKQLEIEIERLIEQNSSIKK